MYLCQAPDRHRHLQTSLFLGPWPCSCCPNFCPSHIPIPHASSPLFLTPPLCEFCNSLPRCCYDVPIWFLLCEPPRCALLLSSLLGEPFSCRSVFLCCIWLLPFTEWLRYTYSPASYLRICCVLRSCEFLFSFCLSHRHNPGMSTFLYRLLFQYPGAFAQLVCPCSGS